MAVVNLKNLAVRGVSVNGDVVSMRTRSVGYQATVMGLDSAVHLTMRHPSPRCSAEADRSRRSPRFAKRNKASGARAGRPGSTTGVLVCRSPAMFAGKPVHHRWTQALGESTAMFASSTGMPAKTLPLLRLAALGLCGWQLKRQPLAKQGIEPGQAAQRAVASTRG